MALRRFLIGSLGTVTLSILIYHGLSCWISSDGGSGKSIVGDSQMLREYANYPLKEQMRILTKQDPRSSVAAYMLSHVVRHGEEAYNALLPFLKAEEHGLDRELAGQGMHWLHGWGYNIRGSEAQRILEAMNRESSSRYWLRTAVKEIRSNPAGYAREYMRANDRLMLNLLLEEAAR